MRKEFELYNKALEYSVSYGWSVIPVDKDKKPAVPWKEYQTNHASEDEMRDWFMGRYTNMGLVTGAISNVAVIDADDGNEFPLGHDTPVKVKTSKGFHLYYQWSEGVRNFQKNDQFPFDIRGEGGYVVLPPSLHPSGKRYEWYLKEGATLRDLPPFPKQGVPTTEEKSTKFDWRKLVGTEEGSRDEKLFKAGCSLLNTPLTPEEIREAMHTLNKAFKPPLPDGTVEIKFKSVMKYYEDKLKKVEHLVKPDLNKLKAEMRQMKIDEKAAPSTGFKDLDKVIKGFIPRHLYTMAGETNVGKTTIAANFAVNVSEQGKKVAYLALEPDIGILSTLFGIITDTHYNDVPEDVDMKNIDIYRQKDIPDVETLEAAMKKFSEEYDLVIVDHIGYFVTDTGNTTQTQANLLKKLALIAKESNTAIFIIAHVKKREGGRKIYMNDISGSAAFKQDSTEVLLIQRKVTEGVDEYDVQVSPEIVVEVAKSKTTKEAGQQNYVRLHAREGYPKLYPAATYQDQDKKAEWKAVMDADKQRSNERTLRG